MKIAICGLVKSSNLGEEFIAKSLAWIIQDEYSKEKKGELEFVFTDILARNDIQKEGSCRIDSYVKNYYLYKKTGILFDAFYVKIGEFGRKTNKTQLKKLVYRIRHFLWQNTINFKRRHLQYFSEKFKGVDVIVIDGAGLLEYSYNEYQEPLNLICEYGEKNSIPVVFNAIGRAGEYSEADFRCKILKKAFSYDCVKYVSARDSVESVQECVGNRFKVKLLADAAFCAEDAYSVKKNADSKLIGIGLIRDDAMLSYGEGINQEQIVDMFVEIARELDYRGYRYQFFTNGAKEDYSTGLRVIEKLGVEKEQYLVKRPTEGIELLNTIGKYRGIVTCRMHSSIGAFSLGIPSVILSWNKKVDKYMEILGYPERAISQDDCKAGNIVNKLEEALKIGISEENRIRMKSLARQSVQDYMYLFSK